jgi:hypothetical protein
MSRICWLADQTSGADDGRRSPSALRVTRSASGVRASSDEGDAEYVGFGALLPPVTVPSLETDARPRTSALASATVQDYLNPCHTGETHSEVLVERRLSARDDDEKHSRFCELTARRPPRPTIRGPLRGGSPLRKREHRILRRNVGAGSCKRGYGPSSSFLRPSAGSVCGTTRKVLGTTCPDRARPAGDLHGPKCVVRHVIGRRRPGAVERRYVGGSPILEGKPERHPPKQTARQWMHSGDALPLELKRHPGARSLVWS